MNRRCIRAISVAREYYIGQVVEFRPPVSGGTVIGVVTKTPTKTTVAFRVTDGNRVYPTGTFVTTSLGWIS